MPSTDTVRTALSASDLSSRSTKSGNNKSGDSLRDRAKYVTFLDPDIANKRSWSMAVKIATQRERNYQRQVEQIERGGWREVKHSAIKTLLGFRWPW